MLEQKQFNNKLIIHIKNAFISSKSGFHKHKTSTIKKIIKNQRHSMKTKTVKKIKLCLMLVSVTLKKRAYCCRSCSFPASAAKLDAMVFISTCLGEEQQSTEGIASSFGVITAADR